MSQITLSGSQVPLELDPISATFKGASREPMHDWYPLLEGYSSKFVRTILDRFAPTSNHVLDPFCGTGTTVLEASRLGKVSSYCEVNPVLQFLVHVKASALSMDSRSRKTVATKLCELAGDFRTFLVKSTKDRTLEETYNATFGESRFFTSQTFEDVLRARHLVDKIAGVDNQLSDFLLQAIVSCLTPASLLVRAGDLRFRRPHEIEKVVPLPEAVHEKLRLIAEDLSRLPANTSRSPLLVVEDAKKLSLLPRLGVDAVVTSPPYVNGTNYFRNTKLELWFLRCLKSSQDLRRFRDRSVTAGINDVVMSRNHESKYCPALGKTLEELRRDAYDRRIPKLVESYFADLGEVFDGLRHHLNAEALLAIDIGDSRFGGVHVPTEKIITQILEEKGFIAESEVFLRKRQSHDGSVLRQVLLVFRQKTRVTPTLGTTIDPRIDSWSQFKERLPHQDPPFSSRNWGHPLHSLCSYMGKMKPSLAYHLVRTFVPNRGRMLDPFAGVGTIPFEGAILGAKSFAFEISPAARIIATAKLTRPDRASCFSTIESLKKFLESEDVHADELNAAKSFGFNRKLEEFYHPKTLKEILLARRYFRDEEPSTSSEFLVMACLLHILHGNRPYALSRRSHPLTPFAPTGPFEYRALLPRLTEKMSRSLGLEYSTFFKEGMVLDQDATGRWPSEVDGLDAIVTSPPFFDSTRFYMANWLRLWFCGWEPQDFKEKPKRFLDERQKLSFRVYDDIFRQARERLKHRGVMVLHLGASKKCDMAQELSKIAAAWFNIADIFRESVVHTESHGIRDKGTVTEHQYLILN